MIQERITSILAWIPDWVYFHLTPHGRKLQSYLNIVHGFTRKVNRSHFSRIQIIINFFPKVLRSRKEQLSEQNANDESENLLGKSKITFSRSIYIQ